MDLTQKLPFTVQYVKPDNTNGSIDISDHPPVLTVNPPTVAEVVDLVVDAANGLVSGALSSLAIGAATFSVSADADLGAGTVKDVLAGPADFAVSDVQVSQGNLVFGAPVSK